jgi:hypothetical protein
MKKPYALSVLLTVCLLAFGTGLALFGSLSLQAQTPPPPPPAAGPTMDQTVGFINESLQRQGVFVTKDDTFSVNYLAQSTQLVGACSMDLYMTINKTGLLYAFKDQSTFHYNLNLGRSDARSVSVEHYASNPDSYFLTVSRAVAERIPLENPVAAPSRVGSDDVGGIVHSIAEGLVTIQTNDDNTLMSYTLTRNTIILGHTTGTESSVMAVGDIKVGDVVFVTPGRTKNGVTEAKTFISFGNSNSTTPSFHRFFTFTDEDLADRVAKAFIHAMVLCHKPEAAPLF